MINCLGSVLKITLALAASPAAGTPCLTQSEAQALVISALPDAIDAARARCLPSLPPTSSLSQAGAVAAARWRTDAISSADEAALALDKVTGFPIVKMLGAKAAREAMRALISREITARLSPANCVATSEMIDALSPLPAQNVARVVLALIAVQPGKAPLPFTLCKSGT